VSAPAVVVHDAVVVDGLPAVVDRATPGVDVVVAAVQVLQAAVVVRGPPLHVPLGVPVTDRPVVLGAVRAVGPPGVVVDGAPLAVRGVVRRVPLAVVRGVPDAAPLGVGVPRGAPPCVVRRPPLVRGLPAGPVVGGVPVAGALLLRPGHVRGPRRGRRGARG
jgi:hypothetical protein